MLAHVDDNIAQAPRKLTDAEDDQFREKYERVWSSSVYRAQLVSADPITLRLFVMRPGTGGAMIAVPVDVRGFEITLDKFN